MDRAMSITRGHIKTFTPRRVCRLVFCLIGRRCRYRNHPQLVLKRVRVPSRRQFSIFRCGLVVMARINFSVRCTRSRIYLISKIGFIAPFVPKAILLTARKVLVKSINEREALLQVSEFVFVEF